MPRGGGTVAEVDHDGPVPAFPVGTAVKPTCSGAVPDAGLAAQVRARLPAARLSSSSQLGRTASETSEARGDVVDRVRHTPSDGPATDVRICRATSSVEAPGRKTSVTPRLRKSGMSWPGMMPPTKTFTDCMPFSFRSSRIRLQMGRWAPDRMDRPMTSVSSCAAAATICSGLCRRPCRPPPCPRHAGRGR